MPKSIQHESGRDSAAANGSHKPAKPCQARIGMQHDAPSWLRQPYILFGYRLGYSLIQSILSPFSLHNETGTITTSKHRGDCIRLTKFHCFLVNIWTHLIPTLIFIWDGIRSTIKWRSGQLLPMLALAKIAYPWSAAVTLGSSSLFHTCNCVDPHMHKRMRTVDFMGISALIIASSW